MPQLRIPEEHFRGLKLLIDIKDELFRAILDAAGKIPAEVSIEKIAITLAAEVKESDEIDVGDLEEIVQLIVAIQANLDGENRDTVVENFVDGLLNSLPEHEEFSNYPNAQIAQFGERMRSLLKSNGIFRICAKAFELRIESERILTDARILTDVRPIFEDEVEQGIAAAMVAHTLRITYRDASGQKEFYVALDDLGLDILLEQIVRSQEKTKAIRSMLERASIPYLDS